MNLVYTLMMEMSVNTSMTSFWFLLRNVYRYWKCLHYYIQISYILTYNLHLYHSKDPSSNKQDIKWLQWLQQCFISECTPVDTNKQCNWERDHLKLELVQYPTEIVELSASVCEDDRQQGDLNDLLQYFDIAYIVIMKFQTTRVV